MAFVDRAKIITLCKLIIRLQIFFYIFSLDFIVACKVKLLYPSVFIYYLFSLIEYILIEFPIRINCYIKYPEEFKEIYKWTINFFKFFYYYFCIDLIKLKILNMVYVKS